MKFKILKPSERYGWVFSQDEGLFKAFGFNENGRCLKIWPKTRLVEYKDILDYFAYMIFCLCEWFELDSMIADDYDYMLPPYEDKPEISAYPTYAGEYFGVMGQLFLGSMIDFGIEGGNLREKGTNFNTNLSKIDLGMSLYE